MTPARPNGRMCAVQRLPILIVSALALSVISACSGDTTGLDKVDGGTSCMNDDNCPSDQHCESGACVAGTGNECTMDSECGMGRMCRIVTSCGSATRCH